MAGITGMMIVFLLSIIINIMTIIRSNKMYRESIEKTNRIRFKKHTDAKNPNGFTAAQISAEYSYNRDGLAAQLNYGELSDYFSSPAIVSDLSVFYKELDMTQIQFVVVDMSKIIPTDSVWALKDLSDVEEAYGENIQFVVAKTETIIKLLAAVNNYKYSSAAYDSKGFAFPEALRGLNFDAAFGCPCPCEDCYDMILDDAALKPDKNLWVWFKSGEISLGAPIWAALSAINSYDKSLDDIEEYIFSAAENASKNSQMYFYDNSDFLRSEPA